ncbi:MAG TPA: ATP-binding protein [Candidatus Binatia bacterium]|nr:ATP-binding protein [Candidatus Binatia bacterium]
MNKVDLSKPVLICFYGYPGSGKTYIARNLAEHLHIAHVDADRLRNELFQNPRYDAQENAVVTHLMNYMTEEFLKAGVSVAYDGGAFRVAQRRAIKELAIKSKAHFLLVWIQIDADSSMQRLQGRDRRTSDDKFAQPYSKAAFEKHLSTMQNPESDDYLVVSGKHTFSTQKGAIVNRLYQMGLTTASDVQSNLAMPELVNLVPTPRGGRVDMARRNISIR